jgi:hypothetical protein
MTLRETELIGKKLVKYGFHRSVNNHHQYSYITIKMNVSVEFKLYFSNVWIVNFTHDVALNTRVQIIEHAETFTPEWLIDEHNKLRAIFKFLKA